MDVKCPEILVNSYLIIFIYLGMVGKWHLLYIFNCFKIWFLTKNDILTNSILFSLQWPWEKQSLIKSIGEAQYVPQWINLEDSLSLERTFKQGNKVHIITWLICTFNLIKIINLVLFEKQRNSLGSGSTLKIKLLLYRFSKYQLHFHIGLSFTFRHKEEEECIWGEGYWAQ